LRTLRAGGIRTRAFDPEAVMSADEASQFGVVASAIEACDGADALAVMTPWPEFAVVDLAAVKPRMRGAALIDPFGRVDPARASAAGFSYARLGTGRAA
jgi:UDPglucose 6-dehydrogenase